jgi:hypothetical protein
MGGRFVAFLDAAERRLFDWVERRRHTSRTRYWSRKLTGPDALRGRQCHCPAGLPIHFVHSEGIRESADVVLDYGSNVVNPERPHMPVEMMVRVAPDIRRASVVYMKTDLLPQFVREVLPSLTQPIILVTAESDWSPTAEFSHLLENPLVLHWFCQNSTLPAYHPRLSPIPIGLDNPVYRLFERRFGFLMDQLAGKAGFDLTCSLNPPGDQARFCDAVVANREMIGKKPLRVLCAYSKRSIPDRAAASRALKGKPFALVAEEAIPQAEYWDLHTEFAFEVSPQGNGLDCFRTWEDLALGTIPIVRTSPLDQLYRQHGLPVAIVNDWAEITEVNLKRWSEELVPLLGGIQHQLSNDYWTDLIRNKARSLV